MIKKLSVFVLLLVLAVSGLVYAQARQPVLTEEQMAELEAIWNQKQELHEEMLEKMVEFGVISSERAQWMSENWEQLQEEGYEFGPGMGFNGNFGYGPCHGNHMMGRGRMGGHRMSGYGMHGHRMGGWRW